VYSCYSRYLIECNRGLALRTFGATSDCVRKEGASGENGWDLFL
jgi:hypothetical protein